MLTFVFYFSFTLVLSAQEKSYTIENSPFLKLLLENRFEGLQVVFPPSEDNKLIDFGTSRFSNYPQNILLNGGAVYVYLNATGVLYKSFILSNKDSLTFTRIDETEHFGYNINCFPFVFGNKIFNLGGYGFWNWNGHLRRFDEKIRGWDIVPLNREVPVSSFGPGFHLWLSPISKSIYTLGFISGSDGIKHPGKPAINSIDSVMRLDLATFDWKSIGRLNSRFHLIALSQTLLANLDSGLLLSNNGEVVYLNILNNRIYSMKDSEKKHFFASEIKNKPRWFKNNMLFFSDSKTWQVDSFRLDFNDFNVIGEEVFLESSSSILNNKTLFSGVIIFAISLFFLGRKNSMKLKKKINSVALTKDDLASPSVGREVFEEIEKALINLILDNMLIPQRRTSTDEVNRILGVAYKSSDMQKRKRSDVIRSINTKYKILSPNNNIQLIDRVKNALDARISEYFIVASEVQTIKEFLG